MCEPTTIVMAITAVVAAVQSADAARKADHAAQDNAGVQATMLAQAQEGNDAVGADKMTERSKQAMRDAGQMQAVFADSGVTGNSQARLGDELDAGTSADLTTLERSRIAGATQSEYDRMGVQARAQSQINSSPRPSIVGTGLQLAAIGANYYEKTQAPRSGSRGS